MITLFLLFLGATIFSLVKWIKDWDDMSLWALGFAVLSIVTIITFIMLFRVNLGTNNLTGYIYSFDDTLGYTTGHIRLSEQAGKDEQPSFCVKSDSEAARQIAKLAGTGKKVRVTEPPYFYFTSNIFECGTTQMVIEEVK